jgi:fermentation-respiration switch protein FrsA (DUF1100 family)
MRALWIALVLAVAVTGCGGAPSGADGGGGQLAAGCDDTTLRPVPADPGARGPWPVGARTVSVDGLVAEVWYPARPGSEQDHDRIDYDLREHLPESERGKIPDEDNPPQPCDCYRDAPLDADYGPYPVVVFVHGTAGFRTQTLTQMTHWASRGFVVLAADNPGIGLRDALAGQFGGDQRGDAARLLDAIEAPAGDLAFLAGRVDAGRIGMAGHSAGGGAIAGFGGRAGVQVLIPMAAGTVDAGAHLRSALIMGAVDDGISRYDSQQQGFERAPQPRRLVGLANAGHLAFSDLCYVARDRGGMLQVALDHGVSVNPLIATLARDGCQPGQLPAEDGWAIIDFATAAVLEETLHCRASATGAIADIEARFPAVAEYREDL